MKKELLEIKRTLTIDRYNITRITGYIVDNNRNCRLEFVKNFLNLEETETFKYLDIFKKVLSGKPGRNMFQLDFKEKTRKQHLATIVKTGLEDNDVRQIFLEEIAESIGILNKGYSLILIASGTYDIPGIATDGVLRCTVFRRREVNLDEPLEIELNACGCGEPLPNILGHTLKTSLFLFAVLLALDLVLLAVGEDRLASVLLGGSIFQPLLCAVLGLVPSCAMSVLLSELYVSGTISFGALVAGLSTGAGFGYIVLLGEKQGRRRAAPVILATFVLAAVGGTVTQLLFG